MADETNPPAKQPSPDGKTAEPAKVVLGAWVAQAFHAKANVALLGGFEHAEMAAGRLTDTPDKFAERFEAFAKAEV